ncbi:glycosyltransferase [Corynebacterium pseudopelargi]|uniref:Glycosyl transferases group 1 n=1 Tax=Corynebacterium pseudopelargi TaxID=2080757 RepID=A0A3G6IVY4_9CORY|nr:glycosyltransferase [Corynebacterium pseudopelargi]AZA08240.1 Glycosyl transferases group 1 [Corynebacterium pseudopelargi]
MSLKRNSAKTIIDTAGATNGGARRFLLELQDYLQRHPREDVRLIGGERLSSTWLVQREWQALGAKKIALNNASFFGPIGERTVLLRNALHFASEEEFAQLGYTPSEHMRKQIPVIRALAHRADRIVVPCHAMAERVAKHAPKLEDRIQVRMHPVSPRGWAEMQPENDLILVPIVPQSYKRLDLHIPALLEAVEQSATKVAVTAFPGDIPEADGHPNYQPIGLMPAEDLAQWWGRAKAIFFPPTLESFGYALAEARCGGRAVIAPDSQQNREIAGGALSAYGADSTLAQATAHALQANIPAEPEPFDPDAYFDWLLG